MWEGSSRHLWKKIEPQLTMFWKKKLSEWGEFGCRDVHNCAEGLSAHEHHCILQVSFHGPYCCRAPAQQAVFSTDTTSQHAYGGSCSRGGWANGWASSSSNSSADYQHTQVLLKEAEEKPGPGTAAAPTHRNPLRRLSLLYMWTFQSQNLHFTKSDLNLLHLIKAGKEGVFYQARMSRGTCKGHTMLTCKISKEGTKNIWTQNISSI